MFQAVVYKPVTRTHCIFYEVHLHEPVMPFEVYKLLQTTERFLPPQQEDGKWCKVIPRSEFNPWSENVKKIITSMGISQVDKIIQGHTYFYIHPENMKSIFNQQHDKMTEVLITEYIPVEPKNFLQQVPKSPTNVEKTKPNVEQFLEQGLEQTQSEHSRHFFFNTPLIHPNKGNVGTLFNLVKGPYKQQLQSGNSNSTLAFCDNSSAIRGFDTHVQICESEANFYTTRTRLVNFTLTAETHNFPTGVCPFPGAATGIGGRIRDNQSAGRGSLPVAGTAGYCVGDLFSTEVRDRTPVPSNIATPVKILIEASNGASDYGNKFGEPIIAGFTRSFHGWVSKDYYEWLKPIMFTGGVGRMDDQHTKKQSPVKGMTICKIGGPAYPIGMGGSHASSRISDANHAADDFNAVQRADPEMEQRMNRVIRACVELGKDNPLVSIHDQGAGGNANVLTEIIEKEGADIYLDRITLGDPSMTPIQIWISEYQESNAVLVHDVSLIKSLCERENVKLDVVGRINGTHRLNLYYYDTTLLKEYNYTVNDAQLIPAYKLVCPYSTLGTKMGQQILQSQCSSEEFLKHVRHVCSRVDVGSKRFLTNKVDRSVSGLVVQQQCVGPKQIPLSNYAMIASGFFPHPTTHKYTGCVTSIGEQPIVGLYCSKSMAEKAFAEALLNMVWVELESLEDIKMSVNWMWPCPNTDPEEGYKMYETMECLNQLMSFFGIVADGGKDSLSMVCQTPKRRVKSPGSVVLSLYASCANVHNRVSPVANLSNPADTTLLYVDLSPGKCRMGGSALSVNIPPRHEQSVPRLDSYDNLLHLVHTIQKLLRENILLAGHDKSDGGLFTTLIEMAFASNTGLCIEVETDHPVDYLFNEEIGVVVQVSKQNIQRVKRAFHSVGLWCQPIATLLPKQDVIKVVQYPKSGAEEHHILLTTTKTHIHKLWESSASKLELLQCGEVQVRMEEEYTTSLRCPEYVVPTECLTRLHNIPVRVQYNPLSSYVFTVGLIRAQGSNGDRELAAAFQHAGFKVQDINMYDILHKKVNFDALHGLAFCGGFSYSDVLGSASGWAMIVRQCHNLFQKFFERPDTFSIGICNGCQLMAKLGWIDASLEQNESKRFESRFSTVQVGDSESIFLRGLSGLTFGMWSAHGEGRFSMRSDQGIPPSTIALQYVDHNGIPTQHYPENPNGSDFAIAALESTNHRHLGIMPHPERCFLKWQLPWDGKNGSTKYSQSPDYTPWFLMFENARVWLEEQLL